MTAKTETPLTDAEELRLAKLGAKELATWTPFARHLERKAMNAKTETPRTDAAKYIGRQSVPSHLAEDLEREAAALKRELTQWREVAGRLAEGLDAVLAHRGVDHEGNHSMWVGETAFLICKDCLAAYDALAKLSEKP